MNTDKEVQISDVQDLFGATVRLSDLGPLVSNEDKAEVEKVQQAIEKYWGALARLASKAFPGSTPDAKNPGYVLREDVHVPFYLLHDLPDGDALDELVALGLNLQVSQKGAICLSGSSVLLRSIVFVGDIDYCEYVQDELDPSNGIAGRVADRALALPDGPIICQQVKTFFNGVSTLWACPEGLAGDSNLEALAKVITQGARQIKLDHVVKTQSVGVVEATNMALLVAGGNQEILAQSFTAQEAPINYVPRVLSDPIELGKYVRFLLEQIEYYGKTKPVKALKRGLSLARILMLPSIDDKIVELLTNPHGALAAAIEARKQLLESLQVSPVVTPSNERRAALDVLIESLRETLETLKKEHSEKTDARIMASCTEWAQDQVLPCLQTLVREARAKIALK